jgi:hypothetical protein
MASLLQNKKAQLDSSLSNLLNNNFDKDSLTCLQTCLKIIDNVLQKPGNEKVRMIRINNPTIQTKITSKKGGVDILISCGFIRQEEEQELMMKQGQEESFFVLTEQNEDIEWLVSAQHTLSQVALHQLNCKPEDLPKFKPPKEKVTIGNNSSSSNSQNSFNVYQGKRFDAQSAAIGQSMGPPQGWKSATEAQLESLEKKHAQLSEKLSKTKSHQVIAEGERQWFALRPGETATSAAAVAAISAAPPSSSREDSALLAGHIQRQQKKSQEDANRGFTTKAMRDLERLKKQKVYSHTLLAISFPDGCVCKGQFLPTETIQTVMESIQQGLLSSDKRQERFELYMTPPRSKLLPPQTLQALGLVPAAKVYISWNTPGNLKGPVGSYLNPTLFQTNGDSSGPALPSSVPVTEGDEDAAKRQKNSASSSTDVSAAKRKKTKAERQAEMLKRMIGK